VKRKRLFPMAGFLLLAGIPALAQQPQQTGPGSSAPAADADVRKKIEAYLRNLYAWGPEMKLTMGPLQDTNLPGIAETTADLTFGEQKDSAKLYVSRDGKYLFRGELTDLSKDPLAEVRSKLKLENAPARGNSGAQVTLVEFADFQCPACKSLHDVLAQVLPKYPQTRLIFKDFPLSQIHPWARTAALAGRCAYQQKPEAFWTFYDRIYADQQLISAENVWDKMLDYASQAALKVDTFKACMTSPEAASAVDASSQNALELDVTTTPTLFVNGRRMTGADPAQVEQYIRYELQRRAPKPATKSP
jgi:protein-disulfide isomerase